MQEQPTWKAHYFNFYGRGESIRMLLSHAKVNYENVDQGVGANNCFEAKASGMFEFGQLPAVKETARSTYRVELL